MDLPFEGFPIFQGRGFYFSRTQFPNGDSFFQGTQLLDFDIPVAASILYFPLTYFPLIMIGVFLWRREQFTSVMDEGGIMQVMLVANDPDEKEIYTYMVRREGLAIASSSDLSRVLKNWSDHPADLLVVALVESMGPVQQVEAIRGITQAPLLLVIDPPSEANLCKLLQSGADVVLSRPVSLKVLAAHMGALIRRSQGVPSFVLPTLTMPDEITLDPSSRTVTVQGGEPRRLTQLEFRLLYAMMTNRGQVIPVEVIVERVWGYTGEGNQDLVRGLVSRLRHKIEPETEPNRYIETIPGVGYRFKVEIA